MNLKKALLILSIIVVGIVSIDKFLYPMPQENCHCVIDDQVALIFCWNDCPGQSECMFSVPWNGYCQDNNCVSWVNTYCQDGRQNCYIWEEPCWDCLPDW